MPIAPSDIITFIKLGWSGVSGLWKFAHRNQRKLTPKEKLELRVKWKPLFETWVRKQNRENLRHDCIIRDMRRIDVYPNIAEGKGISSWFRVGVIDTYERGIMVGLRWSGLVEESGGWRFGEYKIEKDSMKNFMLTGFVPYESIESVDWDGDQYYGYPHIYCYFAFKGEPYERLAYCEKRNLDEFIYFTEIASYDEVFKRTKRIKGRAWALKNGY